MRGPPKKNRDSSRKAVFPALTGRCMSVLLRTTGSVWREGPAACGFQPLGLKSGFFLVLEGDGHHSDSLATVSWWLPSPGLNSNTMLGLGEYCFSHQGDGAMAGSWPGPRLSGVIPLPSVSAGPCSVSAAGTKPLVPVPRLVAWTPNLPCSSSQAAAPLF